MRGNHITDKQGHIVRQGDTVVTMNRGGKRDPMTCLATYSKRSPCEKMIWLASCCAGLVEQVTEPRRFSQWISAIVAVSQTTELPAFRRMMSFFDTQAADSFMSGQSADLCPVPDWNENEERLRLV